MVTLSVPGGSELRFGLTLVVAALGASVMAASTAAHAAGPDWHYLVVEVDVNGSPQPVFHRTVALAAPRPSLTEVEAAAMRRDGRHRDGALDVEVLLEGEVVFRDVVTFQRQVHVEAAGATGVLTRVDRERPKAVVAVRVPAVAGATLILRAAGSVAIELDRIEQVSGSYRLAGVQLPAAAASLGRSGDPGNRVDLLVMGDGFTAAQQTAFDAAAASLQSSFFSLTPYFEYSNYVNLTTLFTASPQSGADHPPYDPGCSGDDPTCCSDPDALSDPLAGSYRGTAFDGRYCAYMIHRLLVVDESKVLAAAAAVPDWDQIFVIVNDATYGGSGGAMAVVSTHPAAPDVVRHEYGHSFSQLADEYESAYPGYPACSDISGPPCEANVTDQTVRAAVKWEPWIAPTTPVPTPEISAYAGVIGLFEGARYRTSGMYRPRLDQCLMRSLGMPFCSVCAQAYVKTLYDGGWGIPASGIDPIEPGSESPPPGMVQVAGSETFSVAVLAPVGGPAPTIEWRVDGTLQSGVVGASFTFTPPGTGTFGVAVTVTDATSLVHPDMAGASLTSSRQWLVEVASVIFEDGFESGTTGAWSGSSP